MKKIVFFAMGLVSMTALAQTEADYYGRVGINTSKPNASLDITRHTGVPAENPQGLLLPHLTTEQRNAFTQSKMEKGLMIFNTTKNCIDWWNGSQWSCTDGTQKDNHGISTPFFGKAIWGDDASEKISVSNQNCSNGQTPVPISYPVNNSQQIIYTATSTISQADADQKAIALMNSTAKQQERQTLAQNYANQYGTCIQTTPPQAYQNAPWMKLASGVLNSNKDGFITFTPGQAIPTANVGYFDWPQAQAIGTVTIVGKKYSLPTREEWNMVIPHNISLVRFKNTTSTAHQTDQSEGGAVSITSDFAYDTNTTYAIRFKGEERKSAWKYEYLGEDGRKYLKISIISLFGALENSTIDNVKEPNWWITNTSQIQTIILPAYGYSRRGSDGFFWSSTPNSNGNGWYAVFGNAYASSHTWETNYRLPVLLLHRH